MISERRHSVLMMITFGTILDVRFRPLFAKWECLSFDSPFNHRNHCYDFKECDSKTIFRPSVLPEVKICSTFLSDFKGSLVRGSISDPVQPTLRD